jgi:hypothetical protein
LARVSERRLVGPVWWLAEAPWERRRQPRVFP